MKCESKFVLKLVSRALMTLALQHTILVQWGWQAGQLPGFGSGPHPPDIYQGG